MAFTDQQKTTIHSIFGLPRQSTAVICTSVTIRNPNAASRFDPTFTTINLEPLNTLLDGIIDGASASTIVACTPLLVTWDEIETSTQKVLTSGEDSGVLIDDDSERQRIRDALSDKLGFAVPTGGFISEAKRRYPASEVSNVCFGGR